MTLRVTDRTLEHLAGKLPAPMGAANDECFVLKVRDTGGTLELVLGKARLGDQVYERDGRRTLSIPPFVARRFRHFLLDRKGRHLILLPDA